MRLFSTLEVTDPATAVSPVGPYDLTDLATVKQELNISGDDTDVMLQRWITAVSSRISKYCDRVFVVEGVTETFRSNAGVNASIHQFNRVSFHPDGANSIELTRRRLPTVSIESIIEDGTRTLVADTDYTVDMENGIVYRLYNAGTAGWPLFSKVEIQYHGGFDPIPGDLVDACLILLQNRWANRGRDTTLRQETIEGVGSKTYWVASPGVTSGEPGSGDDLTPAVAAKLNDYRGYSFA